MELLRELCDSIGLDYTLAQAMFSMPCQITTLRYEPDERAIDVIWAALKDEG